MDTESPAQKPLLDLTLLLEFLKKKGWKVHPKSKKRLALVLLASLFVFPIQAQTRIPKLLNFQSVLTDPAGEPLHDGPYDITFRLVTADGKELYRETQRLDVVRGVVSAMIGAAGGLDEGMLQTASPLFLGVTAAGGGAERLLEIASVPYSMVSEQALRVVPQSIDAQAIKPKSLTYDLLADEVTDKLIDALVQRDIPTLLSKGEIGGRVGATQIGVENEFSNSRGGNVQGVLKDFDSAIQQRQVNLEKQGSDINKRVDTEVTTLNQRVDQEVSTLQTADTNLQTLITTESTNRTTADAVLSSQITAEAVNRSNTDTSLQEQINTKAATDYVNQQVQMLNGSINGSLSASASVGTDVSNLTSRFNAHNHDGSHGEPMLPQQMRPFAFGNVTGGNGACSLNWGANGSRIFNISSTSYVDNDGSSEDGCWISFSGPAGGEYIVIVSPTATVFSQNSSGFGIQSNTLNPGPFSFVVFGNF